MLKRRTLTLVAMLCALVVIVGAGFSAWVFSTKREASSNLGLVVDHATAFGTMSVNGTYSLNLSQGEGADALNNATKGIEVRSASDAKVTEITAKWEISAEGYKDATTPNPIQYKAYIDLKTATVGKYVQVVGWGASSTHTTTDNTEYTRYTETLDVLEADIKDSTTKTGFKEITIRLSVDGIFQYYAADNTTAGTFKKPTTLDTYKTMVNTLLGIANADAGQVYKSTGDYKDIIVTFEVTNPNSAAN